MRGPRSILGIDAAVTWLVGAGRDVITGLFRGLSAALHEARVWFRSLPHQRITRSATWRPRSSPSARASSAAAQRLRHRPEGTAGNVAWMGPGRFPGGPPAQVTRTVTYADAGREGGIRTRGLSVPNAAR
jgi:hypothetical protein